METLGKTRKDCYNQYRTTGTTATTLGTFNPLRYRSYVYDQETGLYYLQSRYYDPEMGRFINADDRISSVGGDVLGNNMFAYCMNNPVNMSDQTGRWSVWAIVAVIVVVVIVIPTVVNHIINACNESKIDSEIKETYTKEEAKEEIDDILDDYSPDCNITFDITKSDGSQIVEISESYNVTSRYDRQKISAIIERTNVTQREFDNISSEWLAHNLATSIPPLYSQAHSVGIDYDDDPRWYVVIPTKILEVLGWE